MQVARQQLSAFGRQLAKAVELSLFAFSLTSIKPTYTGFSAPLKQSGRTQKSAG